MASTFVLYTPINEVAGVRSGGLLSIKTGRLSSAHLAFASEALAREFCARRKVAATVRILDAHELGLQFPLDAKVGTAMRFPDEQALEAYFTNPEAFPYEQHLVPLETSHAA
jgi:hypothetical protein